MQIVMKLAGYTLGRSDLVRRAMAKKKPEEMEKERHNFVYGNKELNVPGCVANGISETVANKIFDEKLSVRETEKLIKILKNPKKTAKKEKIEHTFIYENLEEKMKGIMGTKVNVNPKSNGKGKIEIEYYSEEELERIFDLIMSIQS